MADRKKGRAGQQKTASVPNYGTAAHRNTVNRQKSKVQTAGRSGNGKRTGYASVQKAVVKKTARKAAGTAKNAALGTGKKYVGKELSNIKSVVMNGGSEGQEADQLKQQLQTGKKAVQTTEHLISTVYRTTKNTADIYQLMKEKKNQSAPKKKSSKSRPEKSGAGGVNVQNQKIQAQGNQAAAQTSQIQSQSQSPGNPSKSQPGKSGTGGLNVQSQKIRAQGNQAAAQTPQIQNRKPGRSSGSLKGKSSVRKSGSKKRKTKQTLAVSQGNSRKIKVRKGAAVSAVSSSVSKSKAAKAAVSTIAAPAKAASSLASVTTKTATKAAATAATGGTAGIALAVSSMAKKSLQIFQAAQKNNPFKKIFSGSDSDISKKIIKAILHKFMMAVLIPVTAVMLLCGVFFGVFFAISCSIGMSPARYLYFEDDTLAQMEPLIEQMADVDYGFSGGVFQEAYDTYMLEFDTQMTAYRREGYQIRYDGEGTGIPNNYMSILACLVGMADAQTQYSLSDTLLGTGRAVNFFQGLLEQMCSMTVIDNAAGADADGYTGRVTLSFLTCEDYITESGCSADTAENIRTVYAGLLNDVSAGAGNEDSSPAELPEDVEHYCQGLCNIPGIPGTVIESALSKRGTPYSQAYRDSGSYYDCSSFVYHSYQSAGISMVHGGANTAAAEAQYCEANGQILSVDELRPGDLLFYSYVNNGRYKNISHVEMYLGNGLIIDCTETPGVAVRAFTTDRLVMCGRPY